MLKNPHTKGNRMSGNGRILHPGAMQQPVVQQLQMVQPVNDIQIVCMVAAMQQGTAAERVAIAQDILIAAIESHAAMQPRVRAALQKGQAEGDGSAT